MQYSFLSGSGEGPTSIAVVQPTTTSVMTQPPQALRNNSLFTPWQPSNKPTATVAPTAYPTRYCSDGRLCPNGLRVNDEFGNFYRLDEGEDGACCFDHCSFASDDYFLHYVNASDLWYVTASSPCAAAAPAAFEKSIDEWKFSDLTDEVTCVDDPTWAKKGKTDKDCVWVQDKLEKRCYNNKKDQTGRLSEDACVYTCDPRCTDVAYGSSSNSGSGGQPDVATLTATLGGVFAFIVLCVTAIHFRHAHRRDRFKDDVLYVYKDVSEQAVKVRNSVRTSIFMITDKFDPDNEPENDKAALERVDVDVRKDLLLNLVLTGGGSCFPGMPERLHGDVTLALSSPFKVKVVAPSKFERKFAVWIGGSILSSLGSFQQMWLSRREYEDDGPARLVDARWD